MPFLDICIISEYVSALFNAFSYSFGISSSSLALLSSVDFNCSSWVALTVLAFVVVLFPPDAPAIAIIIITIISQNHHFL